jgi:hypothetical protein
VVRDRRMKHRAEDLAEEVLGVVEVENELRVRRSGRADRAETSGDGRREQSPAASQSAGRRAQSAPTGPSGHNTFLHADAPVLLGGPEEGGEAGREEARGRGKRSGRGRGEDDPRAEGGGESNKH